MFFFGFAAIFLITQMHGLGLDRWVCQAFYSSFLLLVLYVYLVMREPVQVNEVIRIPLIEYLVLFIMYWIYLAGAWLCSPISHHGRLERRAAQSKFAPCERALAKAARNRAADLRRPACHQTRRSGFGTAHLFLSGRLQRSASLGQ